MSRLFLFLCIWLSLWSESVLGSILAIDYGADFIKASLMKPGQPFDVLLNRDSKRKIQSSVGWKKNDRLFGQDAANIVSAMFYRLASIFWDGRKCKTGALLGPAALLYCHTNYATCATICSVAADRVCRCMLLSNASEEWGTPRVEYTPDM